MNDIIQNIVSATPAVAPRKGPQQASSSASEQSGKSRNDRSPASDKEREAAVERQLNKANPDLESLARQLEKLIPDALSNNKLRIDKDETTGKFVYKGVDPDTGEVVKQFPPESVLAAIRGYREIAGLLVDGEV